MFRLLLAVAITVLAAAPTAVHAQGSSFRSLRAGEAARMIERGSGHVTVVFLYAAYCPYCRSMFPGVVELAERFAKRGVSVLAFATDDDADATEAYVGNQRLPFARLHIEHGEKGELTKAFRSAGLDIGEQFSVPLLAIRDQSGKVVGQWVGAGGLANAQRWLDQHVDS